MVGLEIVRLLFVVHKIRVAQIRNGLAKITRTEDLIKHTQRHTGEARVAYGYGRLTADEGPGGSGVVRCVE
jgi:hypothetical protein